MAYLHLYRHGKRISTLEVGSRPYLVGREKTCDLVLGEPSSSREHFSIAPHEDGGYALEDMGSSNGTFVNGVREYRTRLAGRATIQVGHDLLIFVPGETDDEPEELDELPDWALSTAEMEAAVEEERAAATKPVAPAVLRRVQAEARAATRPHLMLRTSEGAKVYPLDAEVTTIGLGPARIPVGEPDRSKEKVLAEVHRDETDTVRVRARGLFGRIKVNGQSRSKATLEPGDTLGVRDLVFIYRPGLDEGEDGD